MFKSGTFDDTAELDAWLAEQQTAAAALSKFIQIVGYSCDATSGYVWVTIVYT